MPAFWTAIANEANARLATSSSLLASAVIICGVPWKCTASKAYDLPAWRASPCFSNRIDGQLATGTT